MSELDRTRKRIKEDVVLELTRFRKGISEDIAEIKEDISNLRRDVESIVIAVARLNRQHVSILSNRLNRKI